MGSLGIIRATIDFVERDLLAHAAVELCGAGGLMSRSPGRVRGGASVSQVRSPALDHLEGADVRHGPVAERIAASRRAAPELVAAARGDRRGRGAAAARPWCGKLEPVAATARRFPPPGRPTTLNRHCTPDFEYHRHDCGPQAATRCTLPRRSAHAEATKIGDNFWSGSWPAYGPYIEHRGSSKVSTRYR